MQELQYSFHFWASVCEKGTNELISWYHMRVPETRSFSCFIYSCSHVSSIHPPIEALVSLVTFSVWSQTLALYARSRVRNKCPCFANLFRPSMRIRASKSLPLCSSGYVASGQDGRLKNDKIMMNYSSLHPLTVLQVLDGSVLPLIWSGLRTPSFHKAWLYCFFGVSRKNTYYLSTKSFCFLEAPVFVSTAVPISTREGHVEPLAAISWPVAVHSRFVA
jgi:hypothetical protein